MSTKGSVMSKTAGHCCFLERVNQTETNSVLLGTISTADESTFQSTNKLSFKYI